MEAFDLEAEKELGEFDDQGNFIFYRKKASRKPLEEDYGSDSQAEDMYMKNIGDEVVTVKETNLKPSEYEHKLESTNSLFQTISAIIPFLKERETPSKAMQRLRPNKTELDQLITLVQIAVDKFDFYDVYTETREALEKYRPKRKNDEDQ